MKTVISVAAVCVLTFANDAFTNADDTFRPPAVPLIACDPYFSVWSQRDALTDVETTHWTGKQHRLSAILSIDGVAHRLIGSSPKDIPPMKQTSVQVLPTRTIYTFSGAGIDATLTFTTPALPDEVKLLSRPVTYITCDVLANDAKSHKVEFHFSANGELATNVPEQKVVGTRIDFANAMALKLGTVAQQVLGKSGDDLRIDWGYLYVAAPNAFAPQAGLAKWNTVDDDNKAASPISETVPVEAGDVAAGITLNFGAVNDTVSSRYLIAAYDDLYSIEYMGAKLRPYWRKDGWEAANLIEASVNEYESLMKRCEQFDRGLMADLEQHGGKEYAQLSALAYRQCFAAGKFVADANGQPLSFCKENHSNGCIATSDVFYPMAPQFLLLGPTLTKSFLVPFMDYAASDRWRFPFAPHDLGTYPKANGQVYGGGERTEENQMPVEESGNMLILFAALAQMEGNADFAGKYWKRLSQWADYLQDKGFDPENQLCTDDFAGHMAHNVNLSAKAICGLGAYAKLCEMRGDKVAAEKYAKLAKGFADQWIKAARNGDHFRLAFDQPDTWSQKYNLVWDRILDLKLFPDEVVKTEMTYYRKMQNKFGLPLDNRSDYTKLDWILWTATLTTNRADFEAMVQPVYKFLQETPDRSPMTDWYFTSTAKKVGFTARPVVGGVFLKMLYDPAVWTKYASMDTTKAADWAPIPVPPKRVTLVETGETKEIQWRFTTDQPAGHWYKADYADDKWKQGRGGFGTPETPSAVVGTRWDSNDIWVRRSFELKQPVPDRVALRIHHDEDSQVFINGTQVAELSGWSTSYETVEFPASVLRAGVNIIAIHCHQTGGGQYIDSGIDAIVPAK